MGQFLVKFRMLLFSSVCSKSTFIHIVLTYLAEPILMGGGEEVEEEEGNGNFTLLKVSVAVFESVCLDGGEPLLITYSP